jgi:hypothetical protein
VDDQAATREALARSEPEAPAAGEDASRGGWFSRLKAGLSRSTARLTDAITTVFRKRRLDDEALEELEETLIAADLGVAAARRIVEGFRRTRFGKEVTDEEVKAALAEAIAEILVPVARPLEIRRQHAPHVVLMVGVNGTGKTTTIAKLGQQYRDQGLKVMFAAGDTFRAAAVEQLQIWGERTGCPVVVAAKQGADAAGLDALPEKSGYAAADLGRASKGAAKGLLAKLYMLRKDYPKAELYCQEIIGSTQYSLQPKYSDNFLPVGENGRESVFEFNAAALDPIDGVTGPGATPYNMIQGVRGIPNLGWGFNRPSDNLVSSFENGDPRREATVIYVGEVLPDGSTQVQDNPEIIGERYNQKAWVPAHSGLQDNGPGNIRVLRYSDILLLAAEALNENGKPAEALVYLNQVRKRARGTNNFILPDVTTTTQSELREKIYKERRVELALEQHRWFDLLRWGRAGSVMQALGKTFVGGKHELMPIPQTEIDLTSEKIKQNPMY